MFQALKSLQGRLCLKPLMTDFKKSSMNEINNEFLNTKINGCFFFYLSQTFWKQVQQFGLTLTRKYTENVNFALKI